ncbi:AraC family transcriptional regulator [Aquincola sp. S2]|uniref:AraC family transcriptional regulator n=1 Tax=Pseudaquabacterium terrae TaxID=2732868 RepID=A0ABX2EE74_9BURK|nr:helix-turn-helix domain-containing protein [Aquabacterium terrae]NRF66930.1 AraC family transcriptional regulator [Aquabacterium terrae]
MSALQLVAPCPALRDHVLCYVARDAAAARAVPAEAQFPAHTISGLVLLHGGRIHAPQHGRDFAECTLLGLQPKPYRLMYVDGPQTTAVLFRAGRAGELLGVAAADIAAQLLDARVVVPSLALQVLMHRSREATTAAARITALEAYLLDRLERRPPRPAWAEALLALGPELALLPLPALAERLGWSPRQLQRCFGELFGVPPKTYQRLARGQAALRGLHADAAASLPALAQALGFADHAHLSRELRDTAGHAPATLRRGFDRGLPALAPLSALLRADL